MSLSTLYMQRVPDAKRRNILLRTELKPIAITSLAVGGGYIVEIVLPSESRLVFCRTDELSLNRVKTASVSSLALFSPSAKHFPMRLPLYKAEALTLCLIESS